MQESNTALRRVYYGSEGRLASQGKHHTAEMQGRTSETDAGKQTLIRSRVQSSRP